MTDLKLDGKLGREEMSELRRRKRRYERQLEEAGYEVHLARGSNQQFAVLVVVDPQKDRRGFLGPNGEVQWLDEFDQAGVGALAQFVVSGIEDEIDEQFSS